MVGQLTFGVSLLGTDDPAAIVETARAAEAAGFDIVTAPDHFGAPAPFSLVAAAASVTERVRLRTYVLNVGFWNPGLLAREIATLDAISRGRVDLGIGAGHMRSEHDELGIPFPSMEQRWAQVETCVEQVRRWFADPQFSPRPVQDPVPVQIAAMGDTGLRCAARTADVVGLAGLRQVPGEPPGSFTLASHTDLTAAVALVSSEAGERSVVLDALLQHVVVDRDPEQALAELSATAEAAGRPPADPDVWFQTPFALFAPSADAGAEELVRRSEQYGITSWCTHARGGPGLAAVRAALN